MFGYRTIDTFIDDYRDVIGGFPRLAPIVPRLQNLARGVTVETELERLQEEATEYSERHRQLSAVRYYLQRLIFQFVSSWDAFEAKGVTNYRTLLDSIQRWRGRNDGLCIVTFNYDTMLEQALPAIRIDVRRGDAGDLSPYVESDDTKIIKLHGSVNWYRLVGAEVTIEGRAPVEVMNEYIDRTPDLEVGPNYMQINNQVLPVVGWYRRPVFPAIAIPFERKRDFECPPEHIAALQQCLPRVRKLLIVGWRATDRPFLELLGQRLPHDIRVMIVAGKQSDAAEIGNRLQQAAGIRGEILTFEGGFTEFITTGAADEFLRK